MYEKDFGFTIKIVGKKSKNKYEGAVPMSDTEGKAFVDTIMGFMDKLTDKPIGMALFCELSLANKQILIFADDNSGSGSAALPYPATASNEVKRFVKLRQIPDNALVALKKESPDAITPSMQSYAALFHSTLERAKADRNLTASLLGMTRDDLDEIELGHRALKPEAYCRFAMFFYDFLEPGDGCSVGLRFDLKQIGPQDAGHIILGHELVHVWRMVTGRRIFSGLWEEEAQTTGLPPFLAMKFSENKLREEHGLGLRTSYNVKCGTAHYEGVREDKGVWPEHMKVWREWKDKHPKDPKFKRNAKISGPVQRIFNA